LSVAVSKDAVALVVLYLHRVSFLLCVVVSLTIIYLRLISDSKTHINGVCSSRKR